MIVVAEAIIRTVPIPPVVGAAAAAITPAEAITPAVVVIPILMHTAAAANIQRSFIPHPL